MSAAMTEVIAVHSAIYEPPQIGDCGRVEIPSYHYCQCRAADTCFDSPQEHAAHVAQELTKAGYGNVIHAQVTALRSAANDAYGRTDLGKGGASGMSVATYLKMRARGLEATA